MASLLKVGVLLRGKRASSLPLRFGRQSFRATSLECVDAQPLDQKSLEYVKAQIDATKGLDGDAIRARNASRARHGE